MRLIIILWKLPIHHGEVSVMLCAETPIWGQTENWVPSVFISNNNESLDPLRPKKIFIRKKLGHTAVSAIKASSVTL